MSRENSPETEGSPGAPQSSTTFHHVMPIIGFKLNQSRYKLRVISAWIACPRSSLLGAVIVISER